MVVDVATNPYPIYEQNVAQTAAHDVAKMPDAKNMTPAEVYRENEDRKAAIEKQRDEVRQEIRQESLGTALSGFGIGGVLGAGYAATRRREKKEAEEKGKQVS